MSKKKSAELKKEKGQQVKQKDGDAGEQGAMGAAGKVGAMGAHLRTDGKVSAEPAGEDES